MLEKFHDALLANDDRFFFEENVSKVTFFANEMGILDVDLDKINLDDHNNFYEGDPDTTIHVRIVTWRNRFEKRKALKKKIDKELVPVAWHPTRGWDWCLSENKKKEVDPIFTGKVQKC